VPVMAEGLVRGMDILRSGRGAVCSTRPCAKGGGFAGLGLSLRRRRRGEEVAPGA
jgi:hypothetical protein